MTDVWAGIPVDLRAKVERYAGSVGAYYWSDGGHGHEVTERDVALHADALCGALRSLLSRLQEAEKDTARLDWLTSQIVTLPPHQGAPQTESLTLLWSPEKTLRNEIDARASRDG